MIPSSPPPEPNLQPEPRMCDDEPKPPPSSLTEDESPPVPKINTQEDSEIDASTTNNYEESTGGADQEEDGRPEVAASSEEAVVEDKDDESGRERLRRHRMEMAGQVWIPEMWGQESMLKDWIDSSVFDRFLVPKGLLSAREAMVVEGCRRRNSGYRRIKNPC
ncbi:hypothetical protein Cni_G06032 [Canna indica]|uniref:Protein BIC1 n=1 Tax=Canna indica TaxID=4628 RepID=A0AAQ3JVS4_9LILI|nr:hypothetical protein Cni_G06032 [Canna indica]